MRREGGYSSSGGGRSSLNRISTGSSSRNTIRQRSWQRRHAYAAVPALRGEVMSISAVPHRGHVSGVVTPLQLDSTSQHGRLLRRLKQQPGGVGVDLFADEFSRFRSANKRQRVTTLRDERVLRCGLNAKQMNKRHVRNASKTDSLCRANPTVSEG